MTTSTAEPSWLCAASRVSPAASARPSIRLGTSAAELAWMVAQPPSWPVFIAASMSTTSAATHLAHDQPVGTHPERLPHQRAQGDLAGALDVGRPRLERHDVAVVGPQLRGVLDETSRSLGPTRESSAFSSVVLPEPVPPLTRKASRRAHHQLEQRRPRPRATAPASTSSASVKTRCRGTRSESTVPGRETGASTAWKREPSGSRRST